MTVLKENIGDSKNSINPLQDRAFSIIANSHTYGIGGWECNRVEARVMDDHYILMKATTVPEFRWETFGVVDITDMQKALDRMYTEAKGIAEERAIKDRNVLRDSTSRAVKKL